MRRGGRAPATFVARAAVLLVILSVTRAAAGAGSSTLQPRIVAGTIAPSPGFALAVCEGDSWFNCRPTCGATLIAPNLVVTSRHCADVAPIDILDCPTYRFSGRLKPARTIWVTAASPVTNAARFWQGARWDVPLPESCGHDLAFLTLAEPVAPDVAPATPAVDHDSVEEAASLPFDVYGYGRVGPDDPVVTAERRAARARLLCAGDTNACAGVRGADLLPSEFALDVVVCPGDSGSGAFVSDGILLGALARSVGGMRTCAYGVYSRLAPHALLLARVAAAAAAEGGYAAPPFVAEALRRGNDARRAPRSFGSPCDGPPDCQNLQCRSDDSGLHWSCVEGCENGCGGGTCKEIPEGRFCFAEPPSPRPAPGGCGTSGGSRPPLPAERLLAGGGWLFVVAFFLRRARRASA